jgi:hypothetical protein
MKCNVAAFPASDAMPYLSGEEVDIQAFQYAGTALNALSATEWDELYSYTLAPSSIIVTRNTDTLSTASATTSADEQLSIVTKSGARYNFTNEAELTNQFSLNVKLIKGGINYQSPGSINLNVDPNDNSLWESTTTIAGDTQKYWRVRTAGIQERHIASYQIKTTHIADSQITTRTLENVSTLSAGTYSYPKLTVDPKGRVTSISSQTALTSTSATGGGSAHTPVDLYFNNTDGIEVPLINDTARISPSGTFSNWISSYEQIPVRSLTTGVGLYDPYIVPLPSGTKKVRLRAWGAGGGCNLHSPAAGTAALTGVYTGGSGSYAEAIYVMDSHINQLVVYIGRGGATFDYGLSGRTGTPTASARPQALSGQIIDLNPLTNLYYDQAHPPGCGGDTIVTVPGVSGNPVTILKAVGGGVKNYSSTLYAELSATARYDEFQFITCAAGGDRCSTLIAKTARYVWDVSLNKSVTGACTFFSDGFDTGFKTAWIAGNSSLSGLEHVLGIDMPSSADHATLGKFTTRWMKNRETGLSTLTANVADYKPFFTFSAPGERGMPVYTNISICHPSFPGTSTCWTVIPGLGSSAFGSNKTSYGAGGLVLTSPLTGNTDDTDGRDGGIIVEIL